MALLQQRYSSLCSSEMVWVADDWFCWHSTAIVHSNITFSSHTHCAHRNGRHTQELNSSLSSSSSLLHWGWCRGLRRRRRPKRLFATDVFEVPFYARASIEWHGLFSTFDLWRLDSGSPALVNNATPTTNATSWAFGIPAPRTLWHVSASTSIAGW